MVDPGATASLPSQPQLSTSRLEGSIARFGFGGPVLEIKVEELRPGRLVRWSAHGGFPDWVNTTVTWEIVPATDGGQEVRFTQEGWPADLPQGNLASVNYTWGRIVGRLKKYAETGEPVPFSHRTAACDLTADPPAGGTLTPEQGLTACRAARVTPVQAARS